MKTLKQRLLEGLSYTSLDYDKMLDEMVELFRNNLTQGSWDNISEADPMFIMLSLFAAHKDILNYMIDYRTLEGYMSTAKERASMVRIANSAGYKIPSYRAATGLYKIDSISDMSVENITIRPFQQFLLPNGESWTTPKLSITNPDNTLDDELWLVQGIPLNLNFSANTIDKTSLTQIVTNQSVSIMTNNLVESSQLTVIYNEDTMDLWKEVESVTGYSANQMVYELNVDPYGITYIKFPIDLDVDKMMADGVTFRLDYVVTNGATTLKGPATFEAELEAFSMSEGVTTVKVMIAPVGDNFVRGSDPATPDEIKNGYINYRGTLDTLVTLDDYKQYMLNQKVVPGVAKVLVRDNQYGTNGVTYNDQDLLPGYVSIYALKLVDGQYVPLSQSPSDNEARTLIDEIANKKPTGIFVDVNNDSDIAENLTKVDLGIFMGYIPGGVPGVELKQMLVDYIRTKDIGDTISSAEIISLILDSKFRSSFMTSGISLKLATDSNPGVQLDTLTLGYNEYADIKPEDIVEV